MLQEVNGQVRWAGGDTVVVQLGDVLDRGDSEIGAEKVFSTLIFSTLNAAEQSELLLDHTQ